jgi:hypothetical protein
MSDSQQALPVVETPVAAPKKALTAIQLIEQEIGNFIKQKEQAIANVNAVDGAIQAGYHLLGKLKAEVAKAEAEAKKLLAEAEVEAGKAVAFVEAELKKI